MRAITEAQAQELANLSGCCITQCEIGPASILAPGETPELFDNPATPGFKIWRSHFNTRFVLNLEVTSCSEWGDMIWRPQE